MATGVAPSFAAINSAATASTDSMLEVVLTFIGFTSTGCTEGQEAIHCPIGRQDGDERLRDTVADSFMRDASHEAAGVSIHPNSESSIGPPFVL